MKTPLGSGRCALTRMAHIGAPRTGPDVTRRGARVPRIRGMRQQPPCGTIASMWPASRTTHWSGDLHTAALVEHGGIHRLALPAALRLPRLLRRAARRRPTPARGLLAPAGGGACTRRRYRRRHAGARDRVGHRRRQRCESSTSCRRAARRRHRADRRGRQRQRADAHASCGCGSTTATSSPGSATTRTRWSRSPVRTRSRLRTPAPTTATSGPRSATSPSQAGDRVPFVLTWSPSHEPAPSPVDPERALAETLLATGARGASGPLRGRALPRRRPAVADHPKALTYGRPAASWRPPPPRCRSRSAAPATGTTATAGCATPPSPCRRCSPPATRRGRRLARLAAARRRRRPGRPADHVRPRRRAPAARDGAALAGGYEKSTPVRIGNAAADQLQLDVWGEVLDGLALTRDRRPRARGGRVGSPGRPDGAPRDGLGPARQRAVGDARTAPPLHPLQGDGLGGRGPDGQGRRRTPPDGPADRWEQLRDTIHADVMQHGLRRRPQHFVQSYGAAGLDASLLLIPRVGFLPADDPRVVGTIDADRSASSPRTASSCATARTRSDDGLPGGEGVFLACSFWLVDALHRRGPAATRPGAVRAPAGLRNDVGLLSEEWDPSPGGSSATRRRRSATSRWSAVPSSCTRIAALEQLDEPASRTPARPWHRADTDVI